MLRRLSIGLVASAIALAPLPTNAQDGTAEDLGDVMSISLKDVVSNPRSASRAHCRVLVHPTKPASVGSSHCLLVTTVFGFLMPSSMPTSATEMATAASLTPMLLVASPPPPAWVTAG